MKQIIVVDDDPGILDTLELIFERAGYDVTAYAGPEPLLNGSFKHPAAILLDRQLSGYDGLDVCRKLKSDALTKSIPVIMISASMNIREMVRNAGADDFVEKPFKIKYLLDVVEKYVQ